LTLGVPLGLGSGLCWGAADFFGGIQSRRLPALTVAIWSQVAGGLALAVALAVHGAWPSGPEVGWGLLAGVGSGVALLLFYRGLAEGVMSVVAPVSACGAVVPVLAAVLGGDLPGAVAGVGIVAAVAGVLLVSRSARPVRPPDDRSARVLAMALGAALGFGLFYVFVDAGMAVPAGSPLWVVAGARVASLLTLSAIALAGRSVPAWPGRRIGPVALVGIADTGANLLFALAATRGNLGVVGVLGSLYPVATVLLARWLLGERLSGGQNAGVALALGGVVLLAAG
jgi:uncharacterized membrane protein